MSISGFIVLDKTTGERLATLPLTIPIGSTIEGYEKAGYEVRWTWTESEINSLPIDGGGNPDTPPL